jgi:uncharacterized protein YfiM (DUF2279 family)
MAIIMRREPFSKITGIASRYKDIFEYYFGYEFQGFQRKLMKNYKILIGLWLVVSTLALQAEDLNSQDNMEHFGISALLGYGFGFTVEKYAEAYNSQMSDLFKVSLSTSLAFSVGLAKEVRDSRQPNKYFSERDLGFDFAGSLTGALLSNYIHRKNDNFTIWITPTQPTQLSLLYRF